MNTCLPKAPINLPDIYSILLFVFLFEYYHEQRGKYGKFFHLDFDVNE